MNLGVGLRNATWRQRRCGGLARRDVTSSNPSNELALPFGYGPETLQWHSSDS